MGHLAKGADAQDKGNSVAVHVVVPTVPFRLTDGRGECPPHFIHLKPARQVPRSEKAINSIKSTLSFPDKCTSRLRQSCFARPLLTLASRQLGILAWMRVKVEGG